MRWTAFTHPDTPLQPHDLWSAWNVDISVLIPLLVCMILYALGARNVWQRAGKGHGLTRRHILSFSFAITVLIIALLSPLDSLSGVLFSAHMTQHLLLVMVAAPLLVLSDLPLAFLWSLPAATAQRLAYWLNRAPLLTRIWKALIHPVTAWMLFAVALWIWHIPTFYMSALENEALHWLEHVSFLLTAMLFWWVLFKYTVQKHVQYGMAVLYLFTTLLQSGVLGALMTFTTEPWYSHYSALTSTWGLTPLQDQQLAGVIMWIPGGALFSLLTILYFSAWLRAMDERSLRVKQRGSV